MKTRLTGFLFGKRKKKERGVAARFGSRPLGRNWLWIFFFLPELKKHPVNPTKSCHHVEVFIPLKIMLHFVHSNNQ